MAAFSYSSALRIRRPLFPRPSRTRTFSTRRNAKSCSICGHATGTAPAEDNPSVAPAAGPLLVPEHRGGRMVAELVGAFNELTERMGVPVLPASSSHILFKSLKLSIPMLQELPLGSDGRSPLTRALSVACLLADLQMDAEVISASVLRICLDEGILNILDVKRQIGPSTSHLLHENLRIAKIPSTVETLDNETSHMLRKFCLTYYDIRAMILELALKLDRMRHLNSIPKYDQQVLSLEVLQIFAPLAHAVGAGALSLELEDLSFRYLFPHSYLYVDTWLTSHETVGKPSLDICKAQLLEALRTDSEIEELVDDITIKGRYKSRFSTMKKLLKDGRRPEDVYDLLGLRVILNPRQGDCMVESGNRACYRVYEIVRSLWKEVPTRTKDYISRPKQNGYSSLHVAVDFSDGGKARPLMEIQIRTTQMDSLAIGGAASHSLYKGGLTDPAEAKRLKAIMLAAAEYAALRLKEVPATNNKSGLEADKMNRVFHLLDKNGDGRISIDELTDVIEELGAEGEDAHELMQLLDVNSDGSLSSDEFDSFQQQVKFLRNLESKDGQYRVMLGEKLEVADTTGLIQVYSKELGDKLAVT